MFSGERIGRLEVRKEVIISGSIKDYGGWRQPVVDRFVPAPKISLMNNQANVKILKEVET